VIYLDSSALLKLIFEEPESNDLAQWLTERQESPKLSSELARVEVLRATRRLDPSRLPDATMMLTQLDLLRLSGGVLDQASAVGEPLLRSLDALHLASALSVGPDLSAFVAYDHRLAEAAAQAGLRPVQPGA
jgi:uncharacterized protein